MAAEAPAPPGVLEALRDNPIAPLLGQPAGHVLAELGLPALPPPPALPPLPGLPALPPLDPLALVKPVTDLFGGFGNGDPAGALNPQALLQNVVQAVDTAMRWTSQGISLLQTMQSLGATAAASAATVNQGVSAAISLQGAKMHFTMGGAATSVATGYAQMALVAARFALTAAGLGLALGTPAGQAALLASAVEAGTEALAITARTKSELAAHKAQMDEAGTRVQTKPLPGTSVLRSTVSQSTTGLDIGRSAGKSASSSSSLSDMVQLFSQLQRVVQPLLSAAQRLGNDISAGHPSGSGPVGTPVLPFVPTSPVTSGHVGTGGLGGTSVGPTSAPLTRWQTETLVDPLQGQGRGASAPAGATIRADGHLPPMIPGTGHVGEHRARPILGSALPADIRYADLIVGGDHDDPTAPVIGGIATARPETTPGGESS